MAVLGGSSMFLVGCCCSHTWTAHLSQVLGFLVPSVLEGVQKAPRLDQSGGLRCVILTQDDTGKKTATTV